MAVGSKQRKEMPMRRTLLVTMALVATACGLTAVAATAGAVENRATCAAVDAAWTDLVERIGALGGRGSIADLRPIYADTAAKFGAAAAVADQGALKDALDIAAVQLNRLATTEDLDDFDGVTRDATFTAAIHAVGDSCGF
ncbi:hypothetical protein VMT65_38095 [Nocardia sp. CDC153]|uniref:hypothetical protein n=1 Tax=Nocardia sp. CDC153 TaxID=3112167 RepID=UPI002DB72676|nr:hypothetical protein [Nocardia sp. CDC153]MEC3958898.1 hypothetical protein [Nocardia sp. CDC153]